MSDTYYLRFFMGPTLTFCWRDALKCQKVYEEFEEHRRAYMPAANGSTVERDKVYLSPLFEVADEFGQRASIDVRDKMIVLYTSTQQASEMNNAMRLGALKGEMHMEKLLKDDSQLNGWVSLKQRMGQIIQPGSGTQQ